MKKKRGGCPICGQAEQKNHRCPTASLRGIDAANRAALNAEDPELDNTAAGQGDKPYWKRLSDGFKMMRNDPDEYEE